MSCALRAWRGTVVDTLLLACRRCMSGRLPVHSVRPAEHSGDSADLPIGAQTKPVHDRAQADPIRATGPWPSGLVARVPSLGSACHAGAGYGHTRRRAIPTVPAGEKFGRHRIRVPSGARHSKTTVAGRDEGPVRTGPSMGGRATWDVKTGADPSQDDSGMPGGRLSVLTDPDRHLNGSFTFDRGMTRASAEDGEAPAAIGRCLRQGRVI